MSVFFTSDTHYSHNNIIKYCNRPFTSVKEMDEALITNHNKMVRPNDTIYFLGDFCFGKLNDIEKLCKRLNGTKILIHGNHDKEILYNQRSLIHLTGSFSDIVPYYETSFFGKKICLFHYGCRVWNGSHKGSWQLYGHSHGTLPPNGRSVDVGVDSPWITGKAEYRPFAVEEIAQFMDKQLISKEDYHGGD